jgi:hypothetical protein
MSLPIDLTELIALTLTLFQCNPESTWKTVLSIIKKQTDSVSLGMVITLQKKFKEMEDTMLERYKSLSCSPNSPVYRALEQDYLSLRYAIKEFNKDAIKIITPQQLTSSNSSSNNNNNSETNKRTKSQM